MKVILLEKIKKLGDVNQIVEVKDGYGWNYLIPQKKAIFATSENQAKTENELKTKEETKKAKENQQQNWIKILKKEKFVFYLKSKEDKKECYGSVNNSKILREINKLLKTKLSNHIFLKDEHLKSIGEHEVLIKISKDQVPLKISIQPIKDKTLNNKD